jgi:hypothetical protein
MGVWDFGEGESMEAFGVFARGLADLGGEVIREEVSGYASAVIIVLGQKSSCLGS